MDYLTALDISASGMSVEKTRLDVTALNLANVNTSRTADGKLFRPLRVVSQPSQTNFENMLSSVGINIPYQGAEIAAIEEMNTAPRMVQDPGHPDADAKGFVAYPGVNSTAEMVNLITATRTYEANVRALNAAKTMALKALEIGGSQ